MLSSLLAEAVCHFQGKAEAVQHDEVNLALTQLGTELLALLGLIIRKAIIDVMLNA